MNRKVVSSRKRLDEYVNQNSYNTKQHDNQQFKSKKKKSVAKIIFRIILIMLLLFLIIAGIIGYEVYNTYNELNNSMQHQNVLSEKPGNVEGSKVYLIVGNDARSSEAQSDVLGSRSDTIMLLIHGRSGEDTLVSLPRDLKVRIPQFVDNDGLFGVKGQTIDQHMNKINSAYSYGGAQLLVKTVELLTNLKIDHYIEVGFDGLIDIVDSVGGVELCYDNTVYDPHSGLDWQAGCHLSDGITALAYSRMRYEDPLGDIGRGIRQKEVIGKISSKLYEKINTGKISNLYNVPFFIDVTHKTFKSIIFDDEMELADLLELGKQFSNAYQTFTNENDISQYLIARDNGENVSPPQDSIIQFTEINYDENLGSVIDIDGDDARKWFKNKIS